MSAPAGTVRYRSGPLGGKSRTHGLTRTYRTVRGRRRLMRNGHGQIMDPTRAGWCVPLTSVSHRMKERSCPNSYGQAGTDALRT